MDGLFAVKVNLEELALKKSVTNYVAILFIIICITTVFICITTVFICITTIATHTLSLVIHTVGVIQVLKSSYSYVYPLGNGIYPP